MKRKFAVIMGFLLMMPLLRADETEKAEIKYTNESIARVSNLVPAMATLGEAGLWVLGLEDDPQAGLYRQVAWRGPLAVVVGSEGFGLRRLVRERCDGLVRLPMHGQIGSLNAAVAGSIVLYEILRYREGAGAGPDAGPGQRPSRGGSADPGGTH